ncbi:MAG: hypothetical protein LBL26_10100 [Peptococcaceae bacterium]|jgi:hypothetical protein|nr:hypothetical protein [Peptococcaceae bacterium]
MKAFLWTLCVALALLLTGVGAEAASAAEAPPVFDTAEPVVTDSVTTAPVATVPVTTAPVTTAPAATVPVTTAPAAGTVVTDPAPAAIPDSVPTAPFTASEADSVPAAAGGESGGQFGTRTVDITGTYHIDQGLFEQNFANKFFYTDIENGGMTSNSVYVELPAGINVRMERDGAATAFVNRMNIVDPGAYVLYLSFMDDQDGIVNGVFRFRIASRGEAADGSAGVDPALGGFLDDTAMTDDEIGALIDSYIYGDAGGGAGAGTGAATRVLTGNGVYTGLDELYDSRAGMFLETTASERAFFSNIPNGAVVNFPVAFAFPAQFGEVSLTRNGEAYPYIPGGTIQEDGAYCMTFGGNDLAALTASGPPPGFNFKIVTRPTADMDIYNAPWGYTVTQALRDGGPLNYQGNVVMMEEDGLYTIELAAEYAEVEGMTVEFTRDTTAPEFRLNGVQNGRSTGLEVTVEYLSEDAVSATLYKDGAAVGFRMDEAIGDPGTYYLVVYDPAGNYATAGFEMRYRMNAVSIGLIIGLVGLLAAVTVLILMRGRRDLRVR